MPKQEFDDWRQIAEEIQGEADAGKLLALVTKLCHALGKDERNREERSGVDGKDRRENKSDLSSRKQR